MSDKELLEFAAKAAGIEYDSAHSEPHPVSKAWWGLWLIYNREPTQFDRRYWNPLTDDGDALRLAVKLKIPLQFPDWTNITRTWGSKSNHDAFDEPHNDDPYAATRLAITRAAAEIGKAGTTDGREADHA